MHYLNTVEVLNWAYEHEYEFHSRPIPGLIKGETDEILTVVADNYEVEIWDMPAPGTDAVDFLIFDFDCSIPVKPEFADATKRYLFEINPYFMGRYFLSAYNEVVFRVELGGTTLLDSEKLDAIESLFVSSQRRIADNIKQIATGNPAPDFVKEDPIYGLEPTDFRMVHAAMNVGWQYDAIEFREEGSSKCILHRYDASQFIVETFGLKIWKIAYLPAQCMTCRAAEECTRLATRESLILSPYPGCISQYGVGKAISILMFETGDARALSQILEYLENLLTVWEVDMPFPQCDAEADEAE